MTHQLYLNVVDTSTTFSYNAGMSLKSDTLLSAWASFFVAHALSVNQIEKELSARAPLSLHEYDVLLTIDRAPERKIRYSELAAVSIFTKSGITRILKRLEDRGLIDRLKCANDGRGAYAQLNKSGAVALKNTWKIYSEEILKIFEPALTGVEAGQLDQIMSKVIDEIREVPLVQIGKK